MGAEGFAGNLKSKENINLSVEQAKSYRDKFFELYPGLSRWHLECWRQIWTVPEPTEIRTAEVAKKRRRSLVRKSNRSDITTYLYGGKPEQFSHALPGDGRLRQSRTAVQRGSEDSPKAIGPARACRR
jgi:hypothetical protein